MCTNKNQHCTKNGVTNANATNNMSIITNEKTKNVSFSKNNTIRIHLCTCINRMKICVIQGKYSLCVCLLKKIVMHPL